MSETIDGRWKPTFYINYTGDNFSGYSETEHCFYLTQPQGVRRSNSIILLSSRLTFTHVNLLIRTSTIKGKTLWISNGQCFSRQMVRLLLSLYYFSHVCEHYRIRDHERYETVIIVWWHYRRTTGRLLLYSVRIVCIATNCSLVLLKKLQ